jgi:7-carboxy-7-deazaguanine synthase
MPTVTTERSNKIGISQIFGPTFQGEGTAAGRHCLFVRVFDCNLTCKWCDTAYTWAYTPIRAAVTLSGKQYDKEEPHYGLKYMSYEEVLAELMKLWDFSAKPTIVVITGGEPMMQQQRLLPLVKALWNLGNDVHIETAGTIKPLEEFDSWVAQYNVSPKLASSGNLLHKRYKTGVLDWFARCSRAFFKFVITNYDTKNDLIESENIIEGRGIPRDNVMMMPEGESFEENIVVARKIANWVLEHGYGLTLREHVYIWPGDKDK